MFVGVLPPPEVVEHLDAFLEPRRLADQDRWRWARPEQWHLTLAFMEEVPARALDPLLERLGSTAARHGAFTCALVGGGALPDADQARVLHAGLGSGQEEVGLLAGAARRAGAASGAPVDGRRFRAHLTLARRNRAVGATRWLRVLETYAGPSWTVEEVALVASYPREGPRGGTRHEVVETVSLGRAGSGPAPACAPRRGR